MRTRLSGDSSAPAKLQGAHDLLRDFVLGAEDVAKARDFAAGMWRMSAQSPRDFGRTDVIRGSADFQADTFEGKLAEIAVSKFVFAARGWLLAPEFGVYDNQHWIDHGQDLGTLKIGRVVRQIRSRIDIKATRSSSQWLLVEQHKFWSDAYILVKIDLPSDLESRGMEISGSKVRCTISGFAYYFDLVDMKCLQPRFEFKKGSRLFGTKALGRMGIGRTWGASMIREEAAAYEARGDLLPIGVPMKTDNYGLPATWLRTGQADWDSFFDWLEASAVQPGA